MEIRHATISDLETVVKIESVCFSAKEAATEDNFRQRLEIYPDCFWLLENEGEVIGFMDGLVTDETRIRDEMFADAGLHNKNGAYQVVLGISTLPEYRRHGYAGMLITRMLSDVRAQERKGCILTCKQRLLHYYAKFGFLNEGVSESVHGDAVWYDMRLVF